ncbi:hypothetical protein GCM10007874_35540 [Labrys miyagiensis]|uniref:DUF992 domain-containing protein n=1 Tax=Labrys miyagiensis TaxID=346912 RepID=A0ABQ6CJJ7_9HYPH|nr:hypothetical protein GCM10007874_35540 [Labrys miyagiensis]
MKMTKLLPALALTALLIPAAAGSAQAAVRTGTLTCDIGGGIGVIVGSSKPVACRYTSFDGETELYNGTVRKLGVDVGFTLAGRIVWAVFEPGRHGSLGGNYAGVSAEATVGAGVGANVLLGGGNGGVTLQPLSVQGQTGLNAAAGIGTLNIEPVAAAVVVTPHRVYHHRHRVHHCTCTTKHKHHYYHHHYYHHHTVMHVHH